jgi:DNA primase
MSLPPGFLDELRTRVTLSSVVGRKVTWDMRKSNMAKGDFWAPCPFHQEKSASFHVDDRKGFYYCFGCHAKGDAVTFVKESENLGFMEAVEVLAREAGMQMPARDPRATEKADHRTLLGQVVEEALKFYRLQLKTSAGAEARRYLTDKRRLPEAAWERWELGWSPESGQALVEALKQKGVSPELMVASGVIAKSDSGRLYDRFHNRLIFPIRDGRGRAISFGGRSLDPNARAKYLNGPETDLFDKGRNLFNHAPAREAAGKGLPLIVAEGYMDVIALSEAGFRAAVAPLGTAVTEDQLRLMWRISDEPVISLDGDKAGIRAALRVIDLALPLLEAGKGLRFAVLPEGQDPDDLIKAQGAGAMQKVLDQAQPMVKLLWNRETEGKVFDSPERKAALDKGLRAALKRIADPSIRGHYGEEIKALRAELFGSGARPFRQWQPRAPRAGGRFEPVVIAPAAATRGSLLAAPETHETFVLEATILAGLLVFPALIDTFEHRLGSQRFSGPGHDRLLDCLLAVPQGVEPVDYVRLQAPAQLETLLSDRQVSSIPFMRPGYLQENAEMILVEAVARLNASRGTAREIGEATKDIEGFVDEGLTWRVTKMNEARFEAQKGPQAQTGEAVIAPNGVALDRGELEQSRKVFESIRFEKPKGRH